MFKDEHSGKDIITITESLNLQGNDKVFWMIKCFIESQRKFGIENSEEILLEDVDLRNQLLQYIKE